MLLTRELLSFGPNVIGATGGSGTRVIARIVRDSGMFMGARLNVSEDALDFGDYSDRWINRFLARRETRLWFAVRWMMRRDLNGVLRSHLSALDAPRPWGWKEPRSIFLLPFFHCQFPSLKFLHVIRDGRDMAFSSNQNQLNKHGRAVLEPAEANLSQPLRSIALWTRINLRAADYGEKHLGGHYLRVRFEDVCADPLPAIRQILDFFGLDGDARQMAGHVTRPESIGRWQHEDPATVAELQRIGRPALEKFGYWFTLD